MSYACTGEGQPPFAMQSVRASKRRSEDFEHDLPFVRRRSLPEGHEVPECCARSCGVPAAHALTGDLATLLHMPIAALDLGVPACRVEELATEEAHAMHDITHCPSLDLNLDANAWPAAPPPSPMSRPPPAMPAFGLGLTRQNSFAPTSLLTDSEAEKVRNTHGRCAAALRRLARRTLHARAVRCHASAM